MADVPSTRLSYAEYISAIEKTHRLIPEKPIEETELCFQHLQMKRIGYFGPEESRSSAFMRRTSKSHPR